MPGVRPPSGVVAAADASAIPPSGAIETVTPAQQAALERLAQSLDGLDYFQLLKLTAEASPGEIKKAFYRESRTYHPDRFFHLSDDALKANINSVYKRITEAYYFLKDDVKRKKYVADVTGPERAQKLRFTEASEVEAKAAAKKEIEEQVGTTPKGRAMWAQAMKDLAAENLDAAMRNLKTAVMYEPGNARYKEELKKVQDALHLKSREKGEQFRIK